MDNEIQQLKRELEITRSIIFAYRKIMNNVISDYNKETKQEIENITNNWFSLIPPES